MNMIPNIIWDSAHTQLLTGQVKQVLHCFACISDHTDSPETPERIVFINGTTYCAEHAAQIIQTVTGMQ